MNSKKLLLFFLSFYLFFNAFAQEKKAAIISGVIKDARSNSPLNEAVVTLSSNAFKGQKFALTDSSGGYRIANLPAGNYTIAFEMEGYEKAVQENIAVHEGISLGVSFQMVKERKGKDTKLKSNKDIIVVKKEEE